jgi:hypothetical protein
MQGLAAGGAVGNRQGSRRGYLCEWGIAASCENWSTGWENVGYLLSGPSCAGREGKRTSTVSISFVPSIQGHL